MSETDANVEAVRRKLETRALIGLKKYGVTTERADLSTIDWLRHAQEEAMDMAVYLERLIRDEEARLTPKERPPIVFSEEAVEAVREGFLEMLGVSHPEAIATSLATPEDFANRDLS